jgi:hypothetical protein
MSVLLLLSLHNSVLEMLYYVNVYKTEVYLTSLLVVKITLLQDKVSIWF